MCKPVDAGVRLIGIVSNVLSLVYYRAGKSTFLRSTHLPLACRRVRVFMHTGLFTGESWPERILIDESRETNRRKASRVAICYAGREQMLACEPARRFHFGN